jgi:hypothetical protein
MCPSSASRLEADFEEHSRLVQTTFQIITYRLKTSTTEYRYRTTSFATFFEILISITFIKMFGASNFVEQTEREPIPYDNE